jgi:hypothetical protein
LHPPKEKLRQFVDGKLDEISSKEIVRHIEACEFCREFSEEYRIFASVKADDGFDKSISINGLVNKLLEKRSKSMIIPLIPLVSETKPAISPYLLAADGKPDSTPEIESLATLYSEDPEIVMKVMRDWSLGHDYLQLISDDPGRASYVLIQVPEKDREFVTDETGRAIIEGEALKDYDKLKWQIKMPDAEFELEALKYDPEKIEKSDELILETENNDKIKVTFERRTKGKQITINILELSGIRVIEDTKVIISHLKQAKVFDARPEKPITMYLSGPEDKINIRLFHK